MNSHSYKSTPTLPILSSFSLDSTDINAVPSDSSQKNIISNINNISLKNRRQTFTPNRQIVAVHVDCFPTKDEKKDLKRRLSDPIRHSWDYRPPSRSRTASKPKHLFNEEDPLVTVNDAKILQNLKNQTLPESDTLELIVEKGRVIAGTSEKLVEWALTDEGYEESSYVEVLILTHSYHMDHKSFFEMLLSKLKQEIQQNQQQAQAQLQSQTTQEQQQQQPSLPLPPLPPPPPPPPPQTIQATHQQGQQGTLSSLSYEQEDLLSATTSNSPTSSSSSPSSSLSEGNLHAPPTITTTTAGPGSPLRSQRLRPMTTRPQSMANIPLSSIHRLRSDSSSLTSSPVVGTLQFTTSSTSMPVALPIPVPNSPTLSQASSLSPRTTYSSLPSPTLSDDSPSPRHSFSHVPAHLPPKSSQSEVSKIQLRILNVIKKWFKMNSWEMNDPELCEHILNEIRTLRSFGPSATKLSTLLENSLQIASQKSSKQEEQAPATVLTSKTRLQFWEIDPIELATELTLQEYSLFKKISITEFFNKAFTDPKDSPHLQLMINRFNEIATWVTSEIVLTPNPKQRTVVLSRFIELAQSLRELNNFNGLMQVLFALEQTPISRLKATWKRVPARLLTVYEELKPLSSLIGNQAHYRQAFANTLPPLIPYQGILLKDLTFIEELPTKLKRSESLTLVNFSKMRALGLGLLNVLRAQSVSYDLDIAPEVREELQIYLKDKPTLSEKETYTLSKQLEPGVKELSASSTPTASTGGNQNKRSANAFWQHHRKSLAQAFSHSWEEFEFNKPSTPTPGGNQFVRKKLTTTSPKLSKRVSFGSHKSSSLESIETSISTPNVNNNAPQMTINPSINASKKKTKKDKDKDKKKVLTDGNPAGECTSPRVSSVSVAERKELQETMKILIKSYKEMEAVYKDVDSRIRQMFQSVLALEVPGVCESEFSAATQQQAELLRELRDSRHLMNAAIDRMVERLQLGEKEKIKEEQG